MQRACLQSVILALVLLFALAPALAEKKRESVVGIGKQVYQVIILNLQGSLEDKLFPISFTH